MLFAGISKGGFGFRGGIGVDRVPCNYSGTGGGPGPDAAVAFADRFWRAAAIWRNRDGSTAKDMALGSVPGIASGELLFAGRQPGCAQVSDRRGGDGFCRLPGCEGARLDRHHWQSHIRRGGFWPECLLASSTSSAIPADRSSRHFCCARVLERPRSRPQR